MLHTSQETVAGSIRIYRSSAEQTYSCSRSKAHLSVTNKLEKYRGALESSQEILAPAIIKWFVSVLPAQVPVMYRVISEEI